MKILFGLLSGVCLLLFILFPVLPFIFHYRLQKIKHPEEMKKPEEDFSKLFHKKS